MSHSVKLGNKQGTRDIYPKLQSNKGNTKPTNLTHKNSFARVRSDRNGTSRSQFLEPFMESSNGKPRITREAMKLNGVVYTPTVLARYVARKTVLFFLSDLISRQKMQKGKNKAKFDPQTLRILDPACGSGELLVAVWQQLKDLTNDYNSNLFKIDKLMPNHVLCGVDNDQKAIQQTKASIQGLFGRASVSMNGNYRLLNTNALSPFNSKTSHQGWKRVLNIFAVEEGFDILIANPPWGADISAYRSKLTREDFSLFQGQYDTSDLFMELALSIVKPGGYISFIIPDSLFSQEREALRKLLLTETKILFIGRLGEKMFGNINRACAVIILKKGKPKAKTVTECLRLTPPIRRKIIDGTLSFIQAENILGHKVLQSRFNHNKNYIFDIDIKAGEEKNFCHFKKLPSTFGDHLKSTRGVELSKHGRIHRCPECKYWMPLPSTSQFRCLHCKDSVQVSEKHTKCIIKDKKTKGYAPLLVGESIRRYSIGSVLWIATDKQGINYKPSQSYWSPKLLLRKTGVGISAAIDYSGAYTNQVVYSFQPHSGIRNPLPLEFFLGVLNSRAMYYFLVNNHGEMEWRSHPYITQSQVLAFPLPDERVLHAKCLDAVQEITELLLPYTRNGKPITEKLDAKIERLVAYIYNLSRDDYKAIYSTLDNVEQLLPVRALRKISVADIFDV